MDLKELLCKALVWLGVMEPIDDWDDLGTELDETSEERKYRFKSFVNREKHIQANASDNVSTDFDDDEWGDC